MAFKHILVAVDFSPHSAAALGVAADVARRYGANLTLVHVDQPVADMYLEGMIAYTAPELARMRAELERRLEALRSEVRASGVNEVGARLLAGVPSTEIVNCAREGGFDLIVLGTHGRTGLAHALIGSVAERIVRTAPCAVLTLKAPS